MKLEVFISLLPLILPVSAAPVARERRQVGLTSNPTPQQIEELAPDLGSHPNNNPNPFGDCDGPVQPDGKIPKVPCACPPLRADFLKALIADVSAGHAVNNPTVKISFPTGNSAADAQGRITASIITLQNLNGPGKGCPGVATTLKAQSDALKAGSSVPPSTPPSSPLPSPAPPPVTSDSKPTADQIAALAPDLGSHPNNNPNPFGDCDGPKQPDGTIPKVPCACPPLRADFLKALTADVAAGHAVNNPSVKITFPTGNSAADKQGRITAAVISLQNLNGPGQGCPDVSTTFKAQSDAIKAGNDIPPPSSPQPPPPASTSPLPTPSAGLPTADQIAALAPDLGSHPNNNPNPFGDCDGPVQPDGKIPKVPCACPPLREDFLKALTADVAAGHAVNNPSVKISFPTGDSAADKQGRITASIITLQNLNGPGKGCPGVATTLKAQSDAIKAGKDVPPPPNSAPLPPLAVPLEPAPVPKSQPALPPPLSSTDDEPPPSKVAVVAPDLGSNRHKYPSPAGDCDGPPQRDGRGARVRPHHHPQRPRKQHDRSRRQDGTGHGSDGHG